MNRQVLVLMNPRAGPFLRAQVVDRLAANLQSRGFQVTVGDNLPRFVELARETWSAGQLQAVVAAGGDGTVVAVARELPSDIPIAVLPLGTENLLAKCYGLRADPDVVAQTIAQHRSVDLDAGMANGRMFLVMLGCGFDAHVVDQVHRARTGHIRHWSYISPILEAIRSYNYPELRICYEIDHGTGEVETACTSVTLQACWAFVANLPKYAVGLGILPGACGHDGLLDLCTFRRGGLGNGLWYLYEVLRGQHQRNPDCTMVRVKRLRIESDVPLPYQLDGDPGGQLPVEITCLPRRLRILVPEVALATPPLLPAVQPSVS